jgi:hypothetical protein
MLSVEDVVLPRVMHERLRGAMCCGLWSLSPWLGAGTRLRLEENSLAGQTVGPAWVGVAMLNRRTHRVHFLRWLLLSPKQSRRERTLSFERRTLPLRIAPQLLGDFYSAPLAWFCFALHRFLLTLLTQGM